MYSSSTKLTQLTPQRQTITAPNSAIICFNATDDLDQPLFGTEYN